MISLNKLFKLISLVIGVILIIHVTSISSEKDKGQSIIMNGGNLIMKEHDKKKKGDTIVIKGSNNDCDCAKKTIPVPYPIMIPQKTVKYVHVPVPVHHGEWFSGHEIMPGGFARSDDLISEPIERPVIGIGEKISPIDYDLPVEGGPPQLLGHGPSIIPEELGILM